MSLKAATNITTTETEPPSDSALATKPMLLDSPEAVDLYVRGLVANLGAIMEQVTALEGAIDESKKVLSRTRVVWRD
jgi:hypothetical protein